MKPITLLISIFLLLGLTTGCGKKTAYLNPPSIKDIAVITVDDNLPERTLEQTRELKITLEWMNRDLIKNFEEAGFHATLIKDMQTYKPEMGRRLIINVERFNPGNRAARAFVGLGAGPAALGLNYKLLDETNSLLLEWRDDVGSNKGPTYCAENLNKKAINKIVGLMNK